MGKLNLDKMDDISLVINGEEFLSVSVVKAYSWGFVMKKQEILDQTVKYIEKYYKEQDNIENVIRNTDKLWETLTDHVAENNAQDFIDHGFFKLSKEKLLEEYYRYVEPFFNEIQYLNDCYFDITADEDQKQAYREARKENRSRVMGIGFGITGGIKASISSGIANAATGMAHSAFNAIANGIGNISKNNKLVDFYNDEETLEHLIDGWTESFWLIIDGQIELINSLLVEEETTGIIMYSQLMKFKQTADNIYNNLQKVKNKNMETYITTMIECICEFPFETTFWKSLASIFCNSGKFSIEISNAFDTTFSQLDEYVEDLYTDFVTDMVVMMIDGYVENIGDNDITSAILEVLDKKLDDEEYKNIFDAIIIEVIASKDVEADIARGVFDLLYKLKNVNIDDYKNNEEIKEQFTKKQNGIAFDFVSEEENAFLFTELQNGNIDVVAKHVKSAAPLVDTEWVVRIMSYIINIRREKGEIVVTRELIDNIEKLKNALSVDFDLNELQSFYDMNNSVKDAEAVEERKNMTLEAKIAEFNGYIDETVKKQGEDIFGKKAYWGKNLSQKMISNAKKNMEIKEDTEILLLFDDTVFGSGKAGFAITSDGIACKNSDSGYCWTMSWKEIIEKSEVTYYKRYDKIVFKNNKKNSDKFEQTIRFTDNGPNIDKGNLAVLIRQACRRFYGAELEIGIVELHDD